jgi:hypothetical protein
MSATYSTDRRSDRSNSVLGSLDPRGSRASNPSFTYRVQRLPTGLPACLLHQAAPYGASRRRAVDETGLFPSL